MPVTQTLTFSATPPTTGENPTTFNYNAISCWVDLKDNIVPDMNTAFSQMNTLETNVNDKEASAVAASAAAVMAANFKGTWTNQTTTVGESWEYGGVIYGVLVSGNTSPVATPSNWIALTTAQAIKNVPSGGLSSTTVQGALNELDTGISELGAALGADLAALDTEKAPLDFTKPFTGGPLFTKASASSITIPIGTSVKVGAAVVSVTDSAYALSLDSTSVGGLDTGTKTAGTDYSVYALEAGGFILSASKTNPTGYTTANSKRIGGFHYGVIPETFTAINNITSTDATKIAGINQYSFWDLKFRPTCDPSGMVHIFGRWYDIYLLNTDHHLYGTSAAGKTIAGGAVLNGRNYPKIPLFYGGDGSVTYGTFTWFEAAEIAKSHSKDMISYNEFVAIAYGVLENSSASTADTGTTQHLADYTSKFGLCMATGCQYIWGKDVFSDTGGTYVWQTGTEGRGQVYSVGNNPKAATFGGYRDAASSSGSRASSWDYYLWASFGHVGCRFACDHLEVM